MTDSTIRRLPRRETFTQTSETPLECLSRITRAYQRAQLDARTVCHIADIRGNFDAVEWPGACAVVVLRALHEMSIARVLGDTPARLDLLVLEQIRSVFSLAMAQHVVHVVESYGAAPRPIVAAPELPTYTPPTAGNRLADAYAALSAFTDHFSAAHIEWWHPLQRAHRFAVVACLHVALATIQRIRNER